MQNKTFIEDLKYKFQHDGMTTRLIFINVIVFVAIQLLNTIGYLMTGSHLNIFSLINQYLFSLSTNLSEFVYAPFGIITSIFAHFSFYHLLMNMLMLYFSGKMFEQLFSSKRLLYTYILGGIAGGLFEIIVRQILPAYEGQDVAVIGASGSIMAIFIALAFFRPNLEVLLFGMFPVKLIILAGIFLILDLIGISSNDGTAHFAHLGGAVIGVLSIQNLHKQTNIITSFQRVTESFLSFFKKLFGKKQPTFKVNQGGNIRGGFKSDEEYNYEQKQKQIIIDQILDKIGKSGYESLSKTEKELLFNQSKNGK